MVSVIAEAQHQSVEQIAEGILHTYHVDSEALGASKIGTYLRCPKSYELAYVQKLPAASSPAAAVGTTVHRVIGEGRKQHWGPHDARMAGDFLVELWARVRPATADPDDPKAALSIEQARTVWLPWYLNWIQGQIDVASEEHWRLTLPNETPISLEGTIDRVYRSNGETIIGDVKTGARAPSEKDVGTDLQLSIYSWAYRQMSGGAESALEIVNLRQTRVVRTTRTDRYLSRVMADVVVPVAEAIRAGIFPANPSTKFGCGYCNHQALCVVGQGPNGGAR